MIFWIIFFGFLLRIVNINQGFWLDEAIGMVAQRNLTYQGILTALMTHDNHPPLYYLLLKAWVSVFGSGEITVRMLSVVFGLGTVYLTYLIGKVVLRGIKDGIFGITAPVFSAVLMATSGLHVYYSQEARMYPMAAFFAPLAVFLYLKITGSKKIIHWILFSVSILLLGMTDYVPFFLFPIFLLEPVISKRGRDFFIKICISFLPLLLAFVFWLPIFNLQRLGGNIVLSSFPTWESVAGGATIKQLALLWIKFVIGRITFTDKIFYGTVVFVSSVIFALPFVRTFSKRGNALIRLWLIVPPVLAFAISFFIPAFIYFRFVFCLPAFYLLLAEGVFNLKNYSKIIFLLVLFVNFFGLGVYYLNKNLWREDWKEAAAFVGKSSGKNEIILFDFPKPVAPYEWYGSGTKPAEGALTSVFADSKTDGRVGDLIKNKSGIWFFVYLRDLSDPQNMVIKAIEKRGFKIDKIFSFRGVGEVFHYVKN